MTNWWHMRRQMLGKWNKDNKVDTKKKEGAVNTAAIGRAAPQSPEQFYRSKYPNRRST